MLVTSSYLWLVTSTSYSCLCLHLTICIQVYTVLSRSTAWAFSNSLPWLLNETGNYMRPAFMYLHKSTSYLDVVLTWTLLDISLSIFHRFIKLTRNSITFFTSLFITPLGIVENNDCTRRLHETRHLFETRHYTPGD